MKTQYTVKNGILCYKRKEQEYSIELREIVYIESNDNYCLINTLTKKHIVRNTMNELTADFEELGFFRVHRKYLVNLEQIQAFSKSDNKLYFSNQASVNVSRTKKEDFKNRLKEILGQQF